MRIISVQFKNNNQVPILIQDLIPSYLSLKYYTLKLKSKSYKTQYSYLTSIKTLFEFYESLDIEFEKEILINRNFNIINDYAESLISWLNNKFLIKKYGNRYSPLTYNNHLFRIRDFLTWLTQPKIGLSKQYNFKTLFNSYLIKNHPVYDYKSLTQKEISFIYNLITPNSLINPFADRVRLRNYLIFLILQETGMRLGELLTLKTSYILRDQNNIYLKIFQEKNDVEDLRKKRPSLKNRNSERIIGISLNTYQILDEYILKHRKKNKNHSYLFTSDVKGRPLSQSSISNIFKIISENSGTRVTPHLMRHNFAERMLRYLIEVRNIELERAKDELRTLLGWSYQSTMPNLYAKNYISELANNHNIERIKNETRKYS